MKTQAEMKAQGFIIDTCCNPPIAYKGPRFAPTEIRECLTDLEEEMLEILQDELGALELWATADCEPDVLQGIEISRSKIETVIAKARGGEDGGQLKVERAP